MKKIIVLALALSTVVFSASAQQKKEHGKKHQHHQKMAKQLNFTEQQTQQAKLIKEDYKKQLQALNKNESITVKEQRDKKEALKKEQKAKMQGLLTVDQKNKLAQLKTDKQAKKQEKFANHLSKMKATIGLTDAQATQLKTQHDGFKSRAKAIKENEGLSRTQRKEQLTALKAEAKESKNKIFTAEQLKKMEEMKLQKKNKKMAK